MGERRDDPFYVGYLPTAPTSLARRSRAVVVSLLAFAAILAVVLLAGQSPFPRSAFEFGTETRFVGVVLERPYPLLLVARPGTDLRDRVFSQYPLVAFGKSGAAEAVEGLDGTGVQLAGTLIYRDGRTMIELATGSIQALDGEGAEDLAALPLPPRLDLGRMTLAGEVVDSKCYLGVMKPGDGKPHRACAARCISGGVPPILLVEDPSGTTETLYLVGEDGRSVNRELLHMVAERVEITGEVARLGDLLILAAEPTDYRRLGSSGATAPGISK